MTEAEKLRMYSNNCAKLADFLKTVPDEKHNQATWVTNTLYQPTGTAWYCGTTACAMGWAAVSKEFEGLRYDRNHGVTINGRESDWATASLDYFGRDVFYDVFLKAGTKEEVIEKLYEKAGKFCAQSKQEG